MFINVSMATQEAGSEGTESVTYMQSQDMSKFWVFTYNWAWQFDIPTLIIRVSALILGQGNWFLVLSYMFCKHLQTPFNLLVVVMATGDGIMCWLEIPLTLVNIFIHYRPHGLYVLCPIQLFAKTVSYNCSLLCIAVIAVVRVIHVVPRIKYKLTKRAANVTSLVILLVTAAIAFLEILDDRSIDLMICRRQPGLTGTTGRKYYLITAGLAVVSFTLIVGCYLTIFVLLRMHKAKMSKHTKSNKIDIMSTLMGVFVSVLFGVCYLVPYTLLLLPEGSLTLANAFHVIGLYDSLITIQVGINPLIYLWGLRSHHKVIADAWRKRLARCRRSNRVAQDTEMTSSTIKTDETERNNGGRSAAGNETRIVRIHDKSTEM